MYPLKNWVDLKKGYVFRQRTWYSRHHLGLDLICKKGTQVYAPFDGKVINLTGIQGGKTVWFYWKNKIMRVMHLSGFGLKGEVNEGDIIGYVGNTGALTTGAHAHIDISMNKVHIFNINNFIDPWTFNWFNEKKYMFIKKVGNGKIYMMIEDKLIHWNTIWKLFNENFENAEVIELNEKEFSKFEIIKNVSIKE